MILRVGDARYRGRAVTVEADIDPAALARAVRGEDATADGVPVAVQARTPPPVHDRVGCLHPEVSVRVRTALAEAGRARGLSTPFDDAVRDCRRRLRELPSPSVETTGPRRAVTDAGAETDRLRERVAETRGRLTARRTLDADTDDTEAALEAAARELAEAETSAVAARQRLDRKRTDARAARETLTRRMTLEDELANLQRKARAALVDRLTDAYASAVVAAPGGPDRHPDDPFAVDPATAGLAVARIADFDAPVVLACDRFPDAAAASAWLGAPVVLRT